MYGSGAYIIREAGVDDSCLSDRQPHQQLQRSSIASLHAVVHDATTRSCHSLPNVLLRARWAVYCRGTPRQCHSNSLRGPLPRAHWLDSICRPRFRPPWR